MAPRLPTRREVLELLGSESRALHAREIAARLSVSEVDYLALQRLLDDLSFEGVLAPRPGQKFKLSRGTAAQRGSDREGLLTVHPRGFGFVASLGDFGDDVFVPPGALAGAMHGDRVRVRISSRGARGAEGEVVGVLERAQKHVAGTLRRKGRSSWVEPDDARVKGPIVLVNTSAHQRGEKGGADGDAVVVAITRWPESVDENPEGEIENVLGRPGDLAIEAAKILVLEGVREGHSPAAIREAEAFGDRIPASAEAGREDLRNIPLSTIDPQDARDHDDAVWVERTERGYRAWIAIADVSMYVAPGSSLDSEAQERGCSLYLPDRAIPMLPGALSSNLCSLLPGVDRLCLCVEADIDSAGTVRASRIIRGVMRSRAKLTYEGVAKALGLSDEGEAGAADALVDGLRTAYDLSRILRARRMKRGALDFELPEAKVVLHEETREPVDVTRRARNPGVKRAYELIEELMLLANETVASWCQERDVPTIYRVHGPPDDQKLDRFAAMCDALGIAFDVEDTRDPKRLSDLLASFSGHPLAPVLNSLLLRSMKQATYDVANIGHFGLASKAYLHFTSPIRRYPDLVVHRIVHEVLSGDPPRRERESADAHGKLGEAALASSIAERRAMDVERAVVDLYRAFLMKDRIGGRFEGTLTAVVSAGVFVQLDSPFVDVLIRLEDLGPDHWAVDDEMLRVVAARSGNVIALGDRIAVEITDVSVLRRTVYAKRAVDVVESRLPIRQDKIRGDKRRPTKKGKRVDQRATLPEPRRGKPERKKKSGKGRRS